MKSELFYLLYIYVRYNSKSKKMGYYTDYSKSSKYKAEDTALYNRLNGVSGHTALGVIGSQLAPQLLQLTIGKLLSGSEKTDSNEKETQNPDDIQRETLQKQLKSVLKEIGASDEKGINTAVDKAQSEHDTNIKAAQDIVDTFANGTDEYSVQISSLQAQLGKLTSENDPDGKQKANIEKQIESLKSKQEKALEKAKSNLQEVTQKEDKKLNNVIFKAEEANAILVQLQNLNAVDDSDKAETSYDAAQEVSDMSKFNTAREKFLKNKTKENAQALKEAYETVDNKTTKAAWDKFLKAEVEKVLNAE